VGDTPSSAAVREVYEECGKVVVPSKLIAVFDGNRAGTPLAAYHAYKLFFLCDIVEDGPAEVFLLETDKAEFFAEDEIPPLSPRRTSQDQIAECFAHLRNADRPTWYD